MRKPNKRKFQNFYGDYKIGKDTRIGEFVDIAGDIGNGCKIQAFVFIPPGVMIEDNCFIGPGVVFTNDKYPPSGKIYPTIVRKGASIGANTTILPGIEIGKNSLIGAGSVITKSIPENEVWFGNPARLYKKMPKIIVTGGNGFVGSNTIKVLQEKGYNVVNCDISEFDIRDEYQMKNLIKKGDKVLHLAAITRFAEADKNPILAFETNALGTKNIAKVCEMNGAERLIYSSTGSVYMPIQEEPPITETFKCQGNSAYACSKYLGEQYIRQECKNTPFIILRYAHLYGEGKIGHGAIGGFIDKMNKGLAPMLYGGKQSNDFTYIKDIVQANLLALEIEKPEAFGEAYNIGTGEELTTEKAFEILSDLFDYHKEFERLPMRTVDPLRFIFDISKARKILGYEPKYNFRDGLKDWFKK